METIVPPVSGYLPIQSAVKMYMNRRGEKSLTNFEKYLQLAIEGYSELGIFEMNAIEVAYIPVDLDSNSIPLPPDFITMCKLGVNLNGRFWTLTQRDDIVIPRKGTICPVPLENPPADIDVSQLGGYFFWPHYRYGAYINTLYGLGGGYNTAYYRIDMSRRIVYFQGIVPNGEIVLEYKSSNVFSGNVVVPRQVIPAIIAFVAWQSINLDPRISMNEKQNLERQYNQETIRLHELECSFSLSEFLDTMYSTYAQSPKR